MPRARSRPREPVGMHSTFSSAPSPKRMMDPFPYIRSICCMAVLMACFLLSWAAAAAGALFSFAIGVFLL